MSVVLTSEKQVEDRRRVRPTRSGRTITKHYLSLVKISMTVNRVSVY